MLFDYRKLHIELSSKCTLKCPRCPRTELTHPNLNQEYTLEDFRKAFPPEVLFNVSSILFCGHIGDPIYATDFLEICRYIKSLPLPHEVELNIITNGSYKSAEWWKKLGNILRRNDSVTFSVDGWSQKSNEKYRVNCNFKSILTGMEALRKADTCNMRWSHIVFNFNEEDEDKMKSLAENIGFDFFQTVVSSKFGEQYKVNGVDPLMPINPRNVKGEGEEYHKQVTMLRLRPNPLFSKSDTFPVSNPRLYLEFNHHKWAKCLRGEKELFIDVSGLVNPCPWFNNGYQINEFIKKHKDRLNVRTRPLMLILEDQVWEEFITILELFPYEICRMKCKK